MNGADVLKLVPQLSETLGDFNRALRTGTRAHQLCSIVFPDTPLFTAADATAINDIIARLETAIAYVKDSGGESVLGDVAPEYE